MSYRRGERSQLLIKIIRQNDEGYQLFKAGRIDDVHRYECKLYQRPCDFCGSVRSSEGPADEDSDRGTLCMQGRAQSGMFVFINLMQISGDGAFLSSAKKRRGFRIQIRRISEYRDLRLSCKTGFRGCFREFPGAIRDSFHAYIKSETAQTL